MTSPAERVGLAIEAGLAGLGPRFELKGRVRRVIGETVAVSGCPLGLGERCRIDIGAKHVDAEVIGLADGEILVQPLADIRGLSVGALVEPVRHTVEPCLDHGRLDLLFSSLNAEQAPTPRRR